MNKNFSLDYLLDILIYGLLAILLAVLQTTLLPRFQIYNALPDIIIGAVCCIGVYRRENISALFGLFAGLCVEALGSTGLSLLPLFYTFAGYVCGRVGTNAREKAHFAAFLISLPLLCLSRTVLSFFNHFINYFGNLDFKQLFLFTILPEYIYTLVMCFPVFLLVKLFEIPLNATRKRGGLY